MAVTLVVLSGSVLAPDGVAITSGAIRAKLSPVPGSVLDGAVSMRVATEANGTVTAGVVAMSLVPNDVITPSGTYYVAVFDCRAANGKAYRWSEKWQLDSADLTLDIGAVPRLEVVEGIAVSTESAVSASVLASATASASSASASAAAALVSEGAAALDSAEALAAQVAAEAARDAAATAGATYASTAAGLAATASGGYFYVPSGDTLIRYLDNAGTAVEVGRLPSAATVQALQILTQQSNDTPSALYYILDAYQNVVAYYDADGGLVLANRTEPLQDRLAELDSVRRQTGSGTDLHQVVDDAGNVIARIDADAGLRLPGLTGTVQAEIDATRHGMLWRPPGAVSLPAGFAPMTKTLRGQERYAWSGSPPDLRPDQARFTGYPFDWTTDPVNASAVRRARSLLTSPDTFTWTVEAITVNDPGGYFPDFQFRDISWLYDRALGKHWFAVPRFTSQAAGFLGRTFGIWSSTDGLVIDYVAFVDLIPGSPTQAWSPEFFVDDDGTVYVIITSNTETGGYFAYHLLRCTDTATFASWEYVGKLTGTAFPTAGNGSINLNDPFMFVRDGVYYVCWKAETAAGGSHTVGQLGIAWATSPLGPYSSGASFTAPGAVAMRGEGPSVVELPPGGDYRFRLFFDNYLAINYGGVVTGPSVFADTNDFVTWTTPAKTNVTTAYGRHTTFVVGT